MIITYLKSCFTFCNGLIAIARLCSDVWKDFSLFIVVNKFLSRLSLPRKLSGSKVHKTVNLPYLKIHSVPAETNLHNFCVSRGWFRKLVCINFVATLRKSGKWSALLNWARRRLQFAATFFLHANLWWWNMKLPRRSCICAPHYLPLAPSNLALPEQHLRKLLMETLGIYEASTELTMSAD